MTNSSSAGQSSVSLVQTVMYLLDEAIFSFKQAKQNTQKAAASARYSIYDFFFIILKLVKHKFEFLSLSLSLFLLVLLLVLPLLLVLLLVLLVLLVLLALLLHLNTQQTLACDPQVAFTATKTNKYREIELAITQINVLEKAEDLDKKADIQEEKKQSRPCPSQRVPAEVINQIIFETVAASCQKKR